MTKVAIKASFHRYVPTGQFKTVPAPLGGVTRVEIERRETFSKGAVVDASDEDAADWIAKGLAKAVSAAGADEQSAQEAGAAV